MVQTVIDRQTSFVSARKKTARCEEWRLLHACGAQERRARRTEGRARKEETDRRMVTLLGLVSLHGGICATEKKTAVHMDARSGGFCMQLARSTRAAGKEN